jgi:hypothetical protein
MAERAAAAKAKEEAEKEADEELRQAMIRAEKDALEAKRKFERSTTGQAEQEAKRQAEIARKEKIRHDKYMDWWMKQDGC